MIDWRRRDLLAKVKKMKAKRDKKYARIAKRAEVKAHVISNMEKSIYPRGEMSPNSWNRFDCFNL